MFVFEDLVYAMDGQRHVVHVYRNRNSWLIKLHEIKYPCECSKRYHAHSISVTYEHIIHCCSDKSLVSILDRSGELLRKIPIVGIFEYRPVLCQVDVEGNFLIVDRMTKRLLIAHTNQQSHQWRIVYLLDLPDGRVFWGAVWFRHRLYVSDNC